MREPFEHCGFRIVPGVLDEPTIAPLTDAFAVAGGDSAIRGRGETYAIRNLLDVPAVRALVDSAAVRAVVEPVLGPGAFAVRGILFDKTPAANWRVPWHQDLTIAVQTRRDVPGNGPWSVKAGVPHVQPPVVVLKRMLTVRLHLDACDAANGPLRVLPSSHREVCLSRDAISRWREIASPSYLRGAVRRRAADASTATTRVQPREPARSSGRRPPGIRGRSPSRWSGVAPSSEDWADTLMGVSYMRARPITEGAEMAALAIPAIHHKFTVDEYCRMAETGILAPDSRVELIDGEIIEMAPIGRRHLACVDRLNYEFVTGLGQRAIVRIQGALRLSRHSEPEPDLVVLRPRTDYYAGRDAGPEDTLLVVEVADTSERYDRQVKVPLYAGAVIPEVWLVDLMAGSVTVYRDPSPTGYTSTIVASGDNLLSPLAFPDFGLTAARILA